jgi:hypothetical protein
MLRTLCPVLALIACACPAVEITTTPVEDPAVTAQVGLLRLQLTLAGGVAKQGKDGTISNQPIDIVAHRANGAWTGGGVSIANFNKGRHSVATLAATGDSQALHLDLGVAIGDDQWVKGDPKATYTIDLKIAQGVIAGTFTGTFQGRAVSGAVTGTASGAGWRGGKSTTADGYQVAWNLGKRRTGWSNARWAVYELSQAADLSSADGLQVALSNAAMRSDAWVDVAVMEDDGSWWHAHDAARLTQASTTTMIDFDDLRQGEFLFNEDGTAAGMDGNWDEDFRLDRSRIRRIAVGVVNGAGIGEVGFTITGLKRAAWKDRAARQAPVTIDLLGSLSVNGQAEVPPGLFGFHTVSGKIADLAPLRPGSNRTCVAMGGGGSRIDQPDPANGTQFMVSGQFDRKQQMPQAAAASVAAWQDSVRASGRGIGKLAAPLGAAAVIEWWNEPYLELGRFLDGFKRIPRDNPDGIKPGDAVVHNGEKLSSMIWIEGRLIGEGKKEKAVFDAAGGTLWRENPARPDASAGKPILVAVDPSRFSYWSGRQIGDWYTQSFQVMASEARTLAPEVKLVGGHGFRWQEDDWTSWEILHKPLVDAAWKDLDGLCDHRYQGLPEGTLASYEFLANYTLVKYKKLIKGYNTECNDLWDAPARGGSASDDAAQKRFVPRRRAFWNLRDLLLCVSQVPDKAAARAIHAQWPVDAAKLAPDAPPWVRMGIGEGEYRGLHLIRNLRGRLVAARSSDPGIIVAASLDAQTSRLVVGAYNDTPYERTISVPLTAPAGTTLAAGTLTILAADAAGILTANEQPQATGTATFTLASGAGACIEMPCTGQPTATQVVRVQRPGDVFLRRIEPGASVAVPLADQPAAGPATHVRARLVLERCTAGEGWIEAGGARVAIPHSPTVPNTPRIVVVDLPAAAATATSITVGSNGPEASDGFLLCAAAIEVER